MQVNRDRYTDPTRGVLHIEGCVVVDLLYGDIMGDPALLQTRGINPNANIGVVVNVIR